MNAITELPADAQLNVVVPNTSTSALVLDSASMDSMMRLAEIMATGRCTMPAEFRNSPGDCLAIVMQSVQWKMNPFAVAQKTHFVSGKIGYEAQLVNAVITAMAPTRDRLHFEWFGPWERILGQFKEVESKSKKDDAGNPMKFRVPNWNLKDEDGLGVRVWSTLKGEDEPRELTLLMAQARTRNSTLWADDPRQQLAYLATKRWARLYCPDVILGVYTPDELDESPRQAPRDMGRAEVVTTGLLDKWIGRANDAKDAAALAQVWKDGLAEIKPTGDMSIYTEFKAAVEAAGNVFKKAAANAVVDVGIPPEMEGLIADLEALADSGTDAFLESWNGLSDATRAKINAIPGVYDGFIARAEKAGA
jgi:hypothetical protein